MTIKSLLLSMMALLAVSTMTLSLTSCGDDDDDDATVSLYKQWKATATEAAMPAEMQEYYSDACFDFTAKGKLFVYVKMKKTVDECKKGKWYTYMANSIAVTPETETTGTFTYVVLATAPKNGMKKGELIPTFVYELTKKTLTLYNFASKPITLKATSGIQSEGYLPTEK